jgi:hypothetical protein
VHGASGSDEHSAAGSDVDERRTVRRGFAQIGGTTDNRRRIYREQLAHYQANTDAAGKLVAVGASPRNMSLNVAEHAAWTMVANLLLNLDESLTKE